MLVHAQELHVVASGIRYVLNARSPQATWAKRSGLLEQIRESFKVVDG